MIAPETRTLDDGTVVELRPGAEIALDYRPGLRRVVLQSGEAHFQVQKDSSRPFVVAAAGVEVRAVGTAFTVDLRRATVEVVVTEGRVAVAGGASPAPGEAAPPPALVAAGEQALVPRAITGPVAVRPLPPDQQRLRLGWRIPMLDFAGTPLREVIPLFNRTGNHRLSLAPELGHLRVSGVMRADDLDSLLFLLKNEFGIKASSFPDGSLVLGR